MKNEYEAKFLNIDVGDLRETIRQLGAEQAKPRTKLTRVIYENDTVQGNQWLRLRDEGDKITLTLKQVTDASSIDGTTEIEIQVNDLQATTELLGAVGLRRVRYQENYREEWRYGEIVFDLDTWPGLPTFLEIEGPDEAAVRQAAGLLRLDYGDARFGSVDEIYKSELGRDILAEPTLLFDNDPQP
ncbi:class IV adenylate cyclase [Streptomyces silvisoli]|uniref:Class IV adenylate cyclase n=1 Tax=Streptomyces silvisoli TaxID=3034235 RepID=A0ABT5ZK03_9ACTN|nr:class IV adenylate cyclase [Streptomyces silvisoli]MDF3290150.1 class IV adenylate cyclase [Streptomyces silvisoli]